MRASLVLNSTCRDTSVSTLKIAAIWSPQLRHSGMAQARVAAVIDGQKRMLKGSVDSMQTLVAATRTAFGLGGGATFEFTVIHV